MVLSAVTELPRSGVQMGSEGFLLNVRPWRRAGASLLTLALILVGIPVGATPAAALSPDLVISQVYGGGGNSGATYTHDVIELFNRGTTPVSLAGLSLQYASATGSGYFGGTSTTLTVATSVTDLPSVTLLPGQYYLVAEASGTNGVPLPVSPDLTDPTPINLSGSAGKVALVTGTTGLGCNGGSSPCTPTQAARILDLVGYGTGTSGANYFEGTAPAPTTSASTSVRRLDNGCRETDQNGSDFGLASPPTPRNTSSPPAPCVSDASPKVTGTAPANGATGVALDASITVSFSETVSAAGAWYSISCSATGAHTATVGGTNPGASFTLDPDTDFSYGETCTVTVLRTSITDADTQDPPDTMDADHVFSFTIVTPTDGAPAVVSTTPADGATDVPVDASISIGFSEAVTFASGSWATIACATSGSHSATVSTGGPAANVYVLDPAVNFVYSETCTVTVLAAQVSDADALDPPDSMTADHAFSFTTAADPCAAPATKIHAIQGTGTTTTMNGQTKTIQGVVVGDYQATGQFSGYYVQEEDADADADPATSEGIFVSSTMAVATGEVVRVTGTVSEQTSGSSSLTRLSSVTALLRCATGASVTATTITLPVPAYADFERYEGMLVTFSQTLTATETFTLGRFGEVRLSANGRLYTPTAVTTPGAAALAHADLNRRSSFVLDDGDNRQNIDPTIHPAGGLSASNTLRSGYTVNGVTGIFDERFSNYRLQPVGPVPFAATNPRTAAPDPVGGNTKVASFNVLNFFNGDGQGGGFPTARGASSAAELARQKAKEVSALRALDADIVGLMELENDAAPYSAIEELVAALNDAAGAGTYAFIDTGIIGTDAIRVALIYKPAAVTPLGPHAILDSSVDPRFIDTRSRPALAQTFQRTSTGAVLTVVVNHLKSKGSSCADIGDPDAGDGQGNCNGTRTQAAAALVDWLATDPTGSGDPDVLIIGDLNAYTNEDPIRTITNAGYANLVRQFGGAGAYSYVFDGQAGYLDHALASPSLAAQATGANEWHINADEPIALDYNLEFKSAGQQASFYDPGPHRSSDHDPVVIGLDLRDTTPPAITFAGNQGTYALDDTVAITCSASDWSGIASLTCTGGTGSAASFGPGTHTVTATATDNAGNSATATTTFTVTATIDGLSRLTAQLVTDHGILRSLQAKLDAAAASRARGNETAVRNQLVAFVRELSAQRGKKISGADATLLSALANGL